MFRTRSRLGILSALLLLTAQCFAFTCRTCNGEECHGKNVEMRECSKFSTTLLSETYPALSKLREKLLYACLKLEYQYEKSTQILEKCIITDDVDTVCANIAKRVPFTHCTIELPSLANLPRKPEQFHILKYYPTVVATSTTNSELTSEHSNVVGNLSGETITQSSLNNASEADQHSDSENEFYTTASTDFETTVTSNTNETSIDEEFETTNGETTEPHGDQNHTESPTNDNESLTSTTGFTTDLNESEQSSSIDVENTDSVSSTVVPPTGDIEQVDAGNITKTPEVSSGQTGATLDLNEGTSGSSSVIPSSEVNFEPTAPVATNPTESSNLDEMIDASLGSKVESSFMFCLISFAIYLVIFF